VLLLISEKLQKMLAAASKLFALIEFWLKLENSLPINQIHPYTSCVWRGDGDKETPLQAAAESGNLGAMQQLLDAKADMNYQSSGGGTALFTAAWNCQTNAMEFLLAKGASPNSLMKPYTGAKLDAQNRIKQMMHSILEFFREVSKLVGICKFE